MPVYERYSGPHVAERVKTVKGSDEDKRLAELVGTDGWRLVEPDRKAKPKGKA